MFFRIKSGQMSVPAVCRTFLSLVLRWAELLQGAVESLQVLPHLTQRVLDLAGLIQNLHAAGKWVVANCKGTLDGCRVSPGEVKAVWGFNRCTGTDWNTTYLYIWFGQTSAWALHPQNSQTRNKQAGRSGPDTAAPQSPQGWTACTLAH